jgi:hypothetical protein
MTPAYTLVYEVEERPNPLVVFIKKIPIISANHCPVLLQKPL